MAYAEPASTEIRPPGTSSYPASLHQRATALRDRTECLIGRNGRDQPVVIIRVFRLVRLLHLEQVHRVNDAAVLADGNVAEQLVLAFELLHLRHHVPGMIAAG